MPHGWQGGALQATPYSPELHRSAAEDIGTPKFMLDVETQRSPQTFVPSDHSNYFANEAAKA